jgi:hypothetical protein
MYAQTTPALRIGMVPRSLQREDVRFFLTEGSSPAFAFTRQTHDAEHPGMHEFALIFDSTAVLR